VGDEKRKKSIILEQPTFLRVVFLYIFDTKKPFRWERFYILKLKLY